MKEGDVKPSDSFRSQNNATGFSGVGVGELASRGVSESDESVSQ